MTRILIHAGGMFNARVYRVEAPDGGRHVEKDFSDCPWIVRNTIGRFLIWRECWILGRLAATDVVPRGVRKLSAFRLREDFLDGFALRDSASGAYKENEVDPARALGVPAEMLREVPPRSFFEDLESGVKAIHAARFVHLDLHNARNIMVGPDWKPVLIDWQSALPTTWMPRPMRRALERIDMAGVYKFWNKFRPGELEESQLRFLNRFKFIRRHFWIPRVHRNPKGKSKHSS